MRWISECPPRVPAEPPYLRGAARRALPGFSPQRSPLWAQIPLRHTALVRSGAHRPLSGTDRPRDGAGCSPGAAPRGWVRISVGARRGSAPAAPSGLPRRGVAAPAGRTREGAEPGPPGCPSRAAPALAHREF